MSAENSTEFPPQTIPAKPLNPKLALFFRFHLPAPPAPTIPPDRGYDNMSGKPPGKRTLLSQ